MHQNDSKWRKPSHKKRNSKKSKASRARAKEIGRKNNTDQVDGGGACTNRVRRVSYDLPLPSVSSARIVNDSLTETSQSSQNLSSTSRKLSLINQKDETSPSENSESEFSQHGEAESAEYFLIHSSALHQLAAKLQCFCCGSSTVVFSAGKRSGLALELEFYCGSCGENVLGVDSSPRVSQDKRSAYEVNAKSVDAILSIGVGYSSLQTFCAKFSMCCMSLSTYHSHMSGVTKKALLLKKEVLKKSRASVRQFYLEAGSELSDDGILDTEDSYDGTWHTRGFKSLFGIGFVIDFNTGLVVDYEVLSKYCHMCVISENDLGPDSPDFALWQKVHKESGECNQNYSRSSGGMEKICAGILWTRSESEGKMRYKKIVADGDIENVKYLNEIKPYSEPIVKEECLNHVSKRLTTGLRQAVSVAKSKGITLGGKAQGALTDKVIVTLGTLYRTAIIRNKTDTISMQRDIKATLLHCSSTNENPDHSLCPVGGTSWCFFNRAQALKEQPKDHSSMMVKLNKKVVEHISPVYERLSNLDSLKRCTQGATQNANEALLSLVWRKCLKNTSASKSKVEIAAAHAVSEFNMGHLHTLELLAHLDGGSTSDNSRRIAEVRDNQRKRKSNSSCQVEAKRARATRKMMKKQKQLTKARSEGPTYGAGLF